MLTVEQAFENFFPGFGGIIDKTRLINMIKFYSMTVIDECTNKAMILEDCTGDPDYKDEDEKLSSISGGFIRNEHWVGVDRDSIQKVKELL